MSLYSNELNMRVTLFLVGGPESGPAPVILTGRAGVTLHRWPAVVGRSEWGQLTDLCSRLSSRCCSGTWLFSLGQRVEWIGPIAAVAPGLPRPGWLPCIRKRGKRFQPLTWPGRSYYTLWLPGHFFDWRTLFEN